VTQLQPPTALPFVAKGTHVLPDGHSLSEVHIWMPMQVPAATHWVPWNLCAKLPHIGSALMPMDAPGAQHSMPDGQSATGSSHCQSVSPVAQGVAMGSQVEGVIALAGGSQQCSVCAVQNSSLPPSTPLNGQKSVFAPASGLGGCSLVILPQGPASGAEPPVPELLLLDDDVAPELDVVLDPELELVASDPEELDVVGLVVAPPPVLPPPAPPTEEPQAPRLAPATQPISAPITSQPFFM
jgi:hypothetical protein